MRKLNVTDRRTDRQTDRQTDGRMGGIAISPVPGPTAPAGDNNEERFPSSEVCSKKRSWPNSAALIWRPLYGGDKITVVM